MFEYKQTTNLQINFCSNQRGNWAAPATFISAQLLITLLPIRPRLWLPVVVKVFIEPQTIRYLMRGLQKREGKRKLRSWAVLKLYTLFEGCTLFNCELLSIECLMWSCLCVVYFPSYAVCLKAKQINTEATEYTLKNSVKSVQIFF